MPHFGQSSVNQLHSCDSKLITLFNEVVKHFDCTILCGFRGEEAQEDAFREGRSKKRWPNSKHNGYPSKAVDVAPYPVDWNDIERFYYFAGFVKGIAQSLGYEIRWGGDWDSDTEVHDQTFFDLPHFELK
jgi:hypothetical protein